MAPRREVHGEGDRLKMRKTQEEGITKQAYDGIRRKRSIPLECHAAVSKEALRDEPPDNVQASMCKSIMVA